MVRLPLFDGWAPQQLALEIPAVRLRLWRGAAAETTRPAVRELEAGLGERWAAELRRAFPLHTAKRAARRLDVEVETVQAWLVRRTPPRVGILLRAWHLPELGPAAVALVLAPGSDLARRADLGAMVRELERRAGRVAEMYAALTEERA